MAFFPFPNHILKLKALDQLQSAGKESLLITICATLCVTFSSKSKSSDVFPKHIVKLKARGQSIQAKNLFCHAIVKNYLCKVLCKFLIKIESTWKREIKE